MIKGLITNAAILVSFFVAVNQLLKEKEVTFDSPFALKVLFGVITGIAGVVLINFSVLVTPTFILDFRQIALIVSACYGGWVPTIIAGIIIGGFRLIYMGINHMAIVGAVAAQILAVGCSLISLLRLSRRKIWTLMTIYCLIISAIVYRLLIKDLAQLEYIIMLYSVGLIILSFLTCGYSEYLDLSNRLMKRLKEESSKDFLTGLNNVRSFDKLYNSTIQNVIKRNEQLSILVIDIDFFKNVNDVYGHQTGDSVLREFSNLLVKTCRQFDIISRNGGEEFSVLLIDCPPTKAYEIGERIRKTVEEHRFSLLDGGFINITVSIGLATLPDMTSDKEEILKLSDKALYMAKNAGRNRVCTIE
jgi:diguanylate cyclase